MANGGIPSWSTSTLAHLQDPLQITAREVDVDLLNVFAQLLKADDELT